METWYKVVVPSTEAGIRTEAIQTLFATILANEGVPKDAAVFTTESDDMKQHIFYFSPGAYRIAKSLIEGLRGVPCEAPVAADLGPALLVGDANALDLLPKAREKS